MIGKEKGKHIVSAVEFYRRVHEIPRSNGLFIDSLQFWAPHSGGGLKKDHTVERMAPISTKKCLLDFLSLIQQSFAWPENV
jgi:hypothetical protein